MSRLIKANPVERLVEGYLKRLDKTNKVRHERAILEKAAKLIGIALHDPCCAPAEEVILGRQENFFIVQLRALLNNIDERKWRQSLERAKKALEDAVLDPCCPVPFILHLVTDAGATGSLVEIGSTPEGLTENFTLAGTYNRVVVIGSTVDVQLSSNNGTCNTLNLFIDDVAAVEGDDFDCLDSSVSGCVHLTFIPQTGKKYRVEAHTFDDGQVCGE